jgi:effector-binding domain-containing protein
MGKNVNTATEPKIAYQPETHYMGIRKELAFDGMYAKIELFQKELKKWFKENGIQASGAPFLIYHRIDLKGEMDMEFGIPVASPLEGTETIKAGILPAGRYVSHIYTGGGLWGNQVLSRWIAENNIPVESWESEKGMNFRARYEQYLTDPKIETRKTKIDILLAMKMKDE